MNKKRIILWSILCLLIASILVVLCVIGKNIYDAKKRESDDKATIEMNAEYKGIIDKTEVVQVSNSLTFTLPNDVENFTTTQSEELEDFLYEEGWDTISAYYKGIYGENPRKVITKIELEPVQTNIKTFTEYEETTDENGNDIMREVYEKHFRTQVSYLLHNLNSSIEPVRFTIEFDALLGPNGEIYSNAINDSYISNANRDISTYGYYKLIENWEGVLKLYKCKVEDGFPVIGDEYYNVASNSWGSDSADLEKYNKELQQKQKDYWPASANSSWDNLLNMGAQFKCDPDTDVWYAIVGNRVCYWIPTEKEWMTEYEMLFEMYYLTSTDGVQYKLYKIFDGRRVWQIGFDRTLTADGSLIVE